jgi:hypothetical protein
MRTCLAFCVALIAVATWISPAFGQRGPVRPETRGMLKSVDAKAGTITIATLDARRETREPVEKTFSLAKDVEVAMTTGGDRRSTIFGVFKEVKLTDLTPGTPIGLTLSADEKTVEAIVAESPTVRGVIKHVDADKGAITITTRPGGRGEGDEEKTFQVAKDAEVAVDDGLGKRFSVKEAKLAELANGSMATIRLSMDQKAAESIFAEGPMVNGQVKTVQAGSVTVTLNMGRGDPEERTIDLAKGGLVLLDDGRGRRLSVKEAKLSDIPVGSTVMIRLSVDQKTATQIKAEGPSLAGAIKAVDAAKGTITVSVRVARGENPEDKTLPVAKDVRVLIEGKETKFADLKAGDDTFAIVRLTLDAKTVQGIIVGRGGR